MKNPPDQLITKDEEAILSIEDSLKTILSRLQELQEKQEEIQKELRQMNTNINAIHQSTSHMDSHIEMVDGVYQQVKDPFFAVMDYAGSFCNPKTKAIKEQSDDETH